MCSGCPVPPATAPVYVVARAADYRGRGGAPEAGPTGPRTAHARSRHRDHLRRDRRRRRAPDRDGRGEILSNVVLSQIAEHARLRRRGAGDRGAGPCRGARPASSPRALDEAGFRLPSSTAIAAAAGPGLIGGVIVGLTTAKALALVAGKPLDRRQPPRGACAVAAAHRRHRLSLSAAARLRRPHPAPRGARASATTSASAPPSTTPSARPSTRSPRCSGLPLSRRAAGRERGGESGDPERFAFPRPLHGRAGRRIFPLRPEDRRAARGGARSRRSTETRHRRPLRLASRPPSSTSWSTAPARRCGVFATRRGPSDRPRRRRRRRRQPDAIRAALQRFAVGGRAASSSRRRWRCAPTTAP